MLVVFDARAQSVPCWLSASGFTLWEGIELAGAQYRIPYVYKVSSLIFGVRYCSDGRMRIGNLLLRSTDRSVVGVPHMPLSEPELPRCLVTFSLPFPADQNPRWKNDWQVIMYRFFCVCLKAARSLTRPPALKRLTVSSKIHVK